MDWIEGQNVFGFTVEKHELRRPGGKPFFPMPTDGGIFVVHTTEGSTVAGALATLAAAGDGPHFVAGENRLVQCRPVGVQGASLHPQQNRFPVIQVECVGFSQTHLYSLPDPTGKPLAALLAWAVKNLAVPLKRPSQLWKDNMSDCPLPWATATNARRKTGIWDQHLPGIYGHIEVQHQEPTNHFDPGALNYTLLFTAVNALLGPQEVASPAAAPSDADPLAGIEGGAAGSSDTTQ